MRSFALVLLLALVGCYAVPAEHEVSSSPSSHQDAGESDMDAGDDLADADPNQDADNPARRDAAMDASNDSGHNSHEASVGSDTGPSAGDAGDAQVSPCGTCADPKKPVCVAATKTCVACTSNEHCGANRYCTTLSECVDCRSNADCSNPDTSVCDTSRGQCVACIDGNDNQCNHIADKKVCSTGKCVQCTAQKRSVCMTTGGQAAVCDATKLECTSSAVRGTDVCGACVSDAQCKDGQACVKLTLPGTTQEVGSFCQTLQNLAVQPAVICGSPLRPYVRQLSGLRTADNANASLTVCTLRASTCPAIQAVARACGRLGSGAGARWVQNRLLDADGQALPVGVKGEDIVPDDSACGVEGVCVATDPVDPNGTDVHKASTTGSYRCSVRCDQSDDCNTNSVCGGAPENLTRICSVY